MGKRRLPVLALVAALPWCSAATGCTCIGDPPGAQLSEAQQKSIDAKIVAEPPAEMVRAAARFADRVELVGYRLSPAKGVFAPGDKVRLTLVWKVDQPLDGGWLQFTHVVSQQGRMLANADTRGKLRAMRGVTGVPLPPSKWPAGKHLLDEIDLVVPKTAPATIGVAAGFYRGRDRAPVTGTSADDQHHAALIWLKVKTTGPGRAKASAVPSLDVPRLAPGAAITLDGALAEPAWSQAALTGPFVNPGNGKPSPRSPVQGSARLLYDDEHLYVAFEVKDAKLRGGFPEDVPDPHLWTRDTVEIMIDPDGDGDNRDYYEIQISPQNLVFDAQFDRYNRPRGGPNGPFGHQDWSANLESVVKLDGTLDDDSDDDEGYTVEARIPWASFTKANHAPPRPGDTWRMNFYAMQNNGGLSWSPILGKGNFHKASRFGRVKWIERTVP